MKCPNCGSTAQVRIDNHETYVWKDIVSVYLIYKCGCGCQFDLEYNIGDYYECNINTIEGKEVV